VVLRSLLATAPGRELDRIQVSGVPRRTYQEIRRRAFSEGWVQEYYVPDGPHFGLPYVTFALVHPFLERMDDDRRRWMENRSLALLWTSPEILFGVFLSPRPPILEGSYRQRFVLTVDARGPTVPAYFDFEGSWARWTRLGGTLAYPQPLPGTSRTVSQRESPRVKTRDLAAARELDLRSMPPTDGVRVLRGEPSLPARMRRVVRAGHLQYRVFPNLDRLPPFDGRSLQRIALVHGQLLPDQRPEGLFQALVHDAGVSPFLYVTDGRTVLLGALSSEDVGIERLPVLETLRRYLDGIEVTREDLRTLSAPILHQYGRPLSSLTTPSGG
jgi:hypothetical protein